MFTTIKKKKKKSGTAGNLCGEERILLGHDLYNKIIITW